MGEVIDLEARRRARDEARQRRDQALRRAEDRGKRDAPAKEVGSDDPPAAGTQTRAPQEEPPETPAGPGRGGTGAG